MIISGPNHHTPQHTAAPSAYSTTAKTSCKAEQQILCRICLALSGRGSISAFRERCATHVPCVVRLLTYVVLVAAMQRARRRAAALVVLALALLAVVARGVRAV